MAELQQLNEFIVKNNTKRTIKCTADGISLERFVNICDLPGAPEVVQQSLQSPVSELRSVASIDNKTIESVIKSIVSVLVTNAGLFVTLEQYSWLARITVATDLLNIPQRYDSSLVSRLSSTLEALELGSYNFSPLVINTIAKHLIEDVPLQDVNLLYVIKKLAITNSKILYYVAVSLVFVGIEAITGSTKSQYRLHTVDEFLKYLEVLNMEHLHSERHNLQIIYQLLKLLSLYENMVLVRHFGKQQADLESEHNCYANFFRVSEQQRMTFQLWLEKSSSLVRLSGNDRDVDYLILADLIEVDMLPLLDDVNPCDDLI
ncbi:uncharacterized protein LOC131281578 [Anopheles ziemanni]|uniref:uncharacterized protein LOC131263958 n=1 Tax=Anopheles coustani TaxID=139045 RepID=UPI00265AD6E9|nr:uncharacterized protein LOC131263958 [Anopheles coustani]XP_058166903.1 uncharacterized protein LOC131281578 [Anopheles ziemanni]